MTGRTRPRPFALPGAEDALRRVRMPAEESPTIVLSATDPANPYASPASMVRKPRGSQPGQSQAMGAINASISAQAAQWAPGRARLPS